MGRLPQDYKPPRASDNYLKLKPGTYHVRILDAPIMGTEGWSLPTKDRPNGVPIRVPMDTSFPEDCELDPSKKTKHFWALPVWHYEDSMVKVWTPTQVQLMDPIVALDCNKKWGDFTTYDLCITRVGSTMNDTEYTVIPEPKTPLDVNIADAWTQVQSKGFDLRRLFANGDPFGGPTGSDEVPAHTDQDFAKVPPEDEIPF